MRIPIFNTLYKDSIKVIKSNEVDISKLNNLNLNNVDEKKYPMIKILNMLPQKSFIWNCSGLIQWWTSRSIFEQKNRFYGYLL